MKNDTQVLSCFIKALIFQYNGCAFLISVALKSVRPEGVLSNELEVIINYDSNVAIVSACSCASNKVGIYGPIFR